MDLSSSRTLPRHFVLYSRVNSLSSNSSFEYGSTNVSNPKEDHIHTPQTDPLMHWYSGHDGPWIPKKLHAASAEKWPSLDSLKGHLKRVHYSKEGHNDDGIAEMIRQGEYWYSEDGTIPEEDTQQSLAAWDAEPSKWEITSDKSLLSAVSELSLPQYYQDERFIQSSRSNISNTLPSDNRKSGQLDDKHLPGHSHIKGAEGQVEELDPWFKVGKVFKVLWSEPFGETTKSSISSKVRYGEKTYSTVRRFVTVREGDGVVSTLPVISHGVREATKSSTKTEHGSIYPKNLIKLPNKTESFKRKAVRILLNGVETFARADSGSAKDIISLSLAEQHNIPISRSESDKELFSLGNGRTIRSIGRAYVPCSLLGDNTPKEYRWFHVLAKMAVPLIIGMGWINKIGLFTKRKDLLVECPSWFGNMPTLKWLGSPQGRISFTADGKPLVGFADTGSDLDFISLKCARRRGFKIDRRQQSRTRVMMADGTICTTEGKVHVSSLELANFDSFGMDFHVLDGLPSDVIFGEEFLEEIDAFNTCSEIMDTGDPYLHGLNTLINLGPIQAFLSRKFGSKKIEAPKKKDSDAVEEEIYWKNKTHRSFARVINKDDNNHQSDDGGEGRKSLGDVVRKICGRCSGYRLGRQAGPLPVGGKPCRCREPDRAITNGLEDRLLAPQ